MLDSVLAKDPANIQVMFVKGSWQLAESRVENRQHLVSA